MRAQTKVGLLMLAVVASVITGASAGNVPTKEKCYADAHIWQASPETKELSAIEIKNRMEEMNTCALGYPNNQLFNGLAELYDAQMLARMAHFLERHPAFKEQFFAEDSAGSR